VVTWITERPIQFGNFLIPDATHPLQPVEQAVRADALGIDLIGIQDHPYQWRFHDTWTLLTAIAMRTERVAVFPDVANLPLRPPAVLAKSAASLDLLSGGRVELGLGAGGFWEAIKAMAAPSHAGRVRASARGGDRVIRLVWSGKRGLRYDGASISSPASTQVLCPAIRSASGWVLTSPGCSPSSAAQPTDGCRRWAP